MPQHRTVVVSRTDTVRTLSTLSGFTQRDMMSCAVLWYETGLRLVALRGSTCVPAGVPMPGEAFENPEDAECSCSEKG